MVWVLEVGTEQSREVRKTEAFYIAVSVNPPSQISVVHMYEGYNVTRWSMTHPPEAAPNTHTKRKNNSPSAAINCQEPVPVSQVGSGPQEHRPCQSAVVRTSEALSQPVLLCLTGL